MKRTEPYATRGLFLLHLRELGVDGGLNRLEAAHVGNVTLLTWSPLVCPFGVERLEALASLGALELVLALDLRRHAPE